MSDCLFVRIRCHIPFSAQDKNLERVGPESDPAALFRPLDLLKNCSLTHFIKSRVIYFAAEFLLSI